MALLDQLKFAGSIARVGAGVVGERVRPAGPVRDVRRVPARVEQLTPEWLTGALCAGVPGAVVEDFALGEGSDGTSSRRALEVRYNAAGRSAGLPEAVFTKSTPSFLNRLLIGVTGAAGAEALFYEAIRRDLKIGAPAGYASAWDPRSCRSMILIEDISRTRGATFGNAITHRIDRAEAESMVREMAAYHGARWADPRLAGQWALRDTESWQRDFNSRTAFDAGAVLAFRWAQEEIPGALHARKGEVRGALMRSLAINSAGPQTLLHQDVHPGNWFRLPEGTLHLYDWQAIARGNWALDVAYALSAGLTVADRRECEQELLLLYLDELGAAGGHPPTFPDALLAYRQQMFHGLVFWTYTLLVGRLQPVQPEECVRELIRRTANAVVDLESLDSLG